MNGTLVTVAGVIVWKSAVGKRSTQLKIFKTDNTIKAVAYKNGLGNADL